MIARFPVKPIRVVLIKHSDAPARGFTVGICERRNGVGDWQDKPSIVATFNAAWEVASARRRATGLPIVDTVSPRPRGGGGERMAA